MTEKERQTIAASIKSLREQGYTYKEIAEKFNVSEETVRLFSKKREVSQLLTFPLLVGGFTKGGY